MTSGRNLISVCVCTFQRPVLLARLLDALVDQRTDGAFGVEVVVVENEAARASEALVRERAGRSPVPIHYHCEPERNISKARNRAVASAGGSLVAFIDDDERPEKDWLLNLHRTMQATGADGVLGPVVPEFPPDAPRWLAASGVLNRARLPTGELIGPRDGRTGNVLLKRSLFANGDTWFDPALGRTGGEDTDFFARQRAAGRTLVWCDEAVAQEMVPPERWSASFHLRRMWRSGTLGGERARRGQQSFGFLARSAAVFGGCALALPFSLFVPKSVRMKVALKAAYCGGVVTGAMGWSSLRERE